MLTDDQMQELADQVVEVLRNIYDPEIPVNIYDLGLIYDLKVSDHGEVEILMTLTSPNCPVAETLPTEVQEKVRTLDVVTDVKVQITFDPPWHKDMMSEEAKLELGIF
ncbi:SUF system Fe-S cluster assembly protein [Thermaurantimonas aggregans]|uniref:SUF system Fe-S cluster assembly protein n=1 Tax=Thermaurantimonas aggregans TaxID=2173829 RepID=A0A401XJ31_9FLAO|nr:SUF system Fe-S cluster assembly protein [Thermaurantimonas aggregans]MCX8148981.1 SUF system Fe-S cluster assembly protein [Thermaurantimonas aggregans]GCD77003.1 SUF system Fe-S cluster assembly protein [Thermaurantimonas aggregans]